MPNKSYKAAKNKSMTVSEPAITYQRRPATTDISSSDKWNPNVPFHVTQEEWMEHIRQIEEGPFQPWEEVKKEIDIWMKEYLVSQLK